MKAMYTLPVLTGDLLLEFDFEPLSYGDRWQLIALIEDRIALHEKYKDFVIPGYISKEGNVSLLIRLRLKRFQIWNSFYPGFTNLIRVCSPVDFSPIAQEHPSTTSHELL